MCQLETATGRPRQINPQDASVVKHFYSIEIDGGRRSAVVEEALGLVESVAAPLVRAVANGDLPVREHRAELALFIAMSWLRTPIWREQQRSLFEQTQAALVAESTRHRDIRSLSEALRGSEWEASSDKDLEEMRLSFVAGLESGELGIEMPANNLIKIFLQHSTIMGWMLFALDWTVVRTDSHPFVLADTPVSLFDPTPPYPGSGAGILSSPNVQIFVPLDPWFGIMIEPNPDILDGLRPLSHKLGPMLEEERTEIMGPLEGRWAEAVPLNEYVNELNLRSYAHAQRFIYGTQKAVCDAHSFARRHPKRRAVVTPAPPRIHILEDDPTRPGMLQAWRVFEPEPPKSRHTAKRRR